MDISQDKNKVILDESVTYCHPATTTTATTTAARKSTMVTSKAAETATARKANQWKKINGLVNNWISKISNKKTCINRKSYISGTSVLASLFMRLTNCLD